MNAGQAFGLFLLLEHLKNDNLFMPGEKFEKIFYTTKLTILGWFLFINSPFVIVFLWHDPRVFVAFIPLLFIVPIADLYLFLVSKNYIKITQDKFIWRSALGQLQEIEIANVEKVYRQVGEVISFEVLTKEGIKFPLPYFVNGRVKEINRFLKENFGIEGEDNKMNIGTHIIAAILIIVTLVFVIVLSYILKSIYHY